MKKVFSILICSLVLFWALPTNLKAESIQNFITEITVNQDSSMDVVEVIDYDFEQLQRHGIFRTLPYSYKTDSGKFKLRYSSFTVTDTNGNKIPFEQSKEGSDIKLKIGDPDKTVSGLYQYRISYTVNRAINYFPDHDELYWNVIGGAWEVPILISQVNVNLPQSAQNLKCYTGLFGSKTECSSTTATENNVSFQHALPLNPGEFFTIVVGLPAGSVNKPTPTERLLDFVRDNGIFFLPFFIFILMFYLWNKYGRDAKSKEVVVPQYEAPKNLSPLYIGTLVDGKLDNRDLSAELIYLATNGYIKIEQIESTKFLWFKGQDFKITKSKDSGSELSAQTVKLFDALFKSSVGSEIKLSDFKRDTVFGAALRTIHTEVYQQLKTLGYYKKNPKTIQGGVIIAGVVFAWGFTVLLGNLFGSAGAISGILSGAVIILFGLIMPARTKLGVETRDYILGLKLYMYVAEKDRLAFHNAPEKKPEQFEKLLPYAVALGVEKEWARQFEGIYKEQPNWYSNSTGRALNTALLSDSISDFSSSMQSAVSITTASGGGSGFSGGGSGGGGGGGGGGSW